MYVSVCGGGVRGEGHRVRVNKCVYAEWGLGGGVEGKGRCT